jgi:SlyX protein
MRGIVHVKTKTEAMMRGKESEINLSQIKISIMLRSMEEQMINLEIKIAHQEALIEELSQVLYQQQNQISKMQKTLDDLINRYKEVEKNSTEIGPGNEKPPHY